MFKIDRALLFLIVLVCLVVSFTLVKTVSDPTFFAGAGPESGSPELFRPSYTPVVEEVLEELKEGWELFQNEGYAFMIQVPQQVSRKSILDQEALNYGLGVSPEAPVWEFEVEDPALVDGTNLIEASVVVHVLRGEEAVQACSAPKPGSILVRRDEPDRELPTVEINGIPFWKDVVEEGVMGELYTLISYRTRANEACYEITQLIHSRNLGLFEPGTVEAYDEEAVIDRLDQVAYTFQLLDNEPTFPDVSYPAPKSFSTAVSKAPDDHVYGLDVSHWQGDIHWPQVVDAGYKYTFVKATEGVGWLDVKFIENITEATAAGELMGAYHFARPDFDHSAQEEAEYFLSQVGDYLESGYIRPVLDLEVGYGLTKTQMTNWVMEWMGTVESRSGVEPMIYTNLNFVNNYLKDEVTQYDLWIAYWTCEPEPSFDIPPTGKWADWSFWQYYGPGGCGANAGYVPGIETNIDLNIFNGVESGLGEYDAASPLWVSLTSDAYLAPAPYYADITADVNGDTEGPVNYHFWWDCAALEADLAAVEAACGELPDPEEGSCEANDSGQRCLGVNSEVQIGEYAYREIGDYTAKVIVERGESPPAEDRYKIITYNPIRYTTLDPASTAEAVIDTPLDLTAEVRMVTTLSGVLQVSVRDAADGSVEDQACTTVGHDAKVTKSFDLSWTESSLGQTSYQVWSRYRAGASCPITDEDPDDRVETYQVDWVEPDPTLALERPEGSEIAGGGEDVVGDRMIQETVTLSYLVQNPSSSQGMEITAENLDNPVNVSGLDLAPSSPLTVDPGSELTLDVSFQVDQTGPFSFDLALEHDAANPSPYRITIRGEGVDRPDPVQSLDPLPASPGQAWIGDRYPLRVEAGVDVRADGVLQASVVDAEDGTVVDAVCRPIADGTAGTESFDLAWVESAPGEADYQVWARYREGGSCPVTDAQSQDLSQRYLVNWQEDPPTLAVEAPDGSPLAPGDTHEVGELDFYQTVTLDYVLHNTSTTSPLQVTGAAAENLNNLSGVEITPSGSFELAPGAKKALNVQFLVENRGDFGFDLAVRHEGTNDSPYRTAVSGSGVLAVEPVQAFSLDPADPGTPLIGEAFQLGLEVMLDTPAAGIVRVRAVRDGAGSTADQACLAVDTTGESTRNLSLSWTESSSGEQAYTVEAAYQAGGSCPWSGEADGTLVQDYAVTWVEEAPTLEVQRPADQVLVSGSTDELGEYEYYQELTLQYVVRNTSRTTPMTISGVSAVNLENLSDVDLDPSGSIRLDPGDDKQLTVRFRVENTGALSFDLNLAHDGDNASPYTITVEGTGVLTDNPIQYLSPDPLPPASALINTDFTLDAEAGLSVPDQGALQVRILAAGSGEVLDQACRPVSGPDQDKARVELSWTEVSPGEREYQLQARYQAQGSCPLGNTYDLERTQDYRVVWREIAPALEIQAEDGSVLGSGDLDQLGSTTFGQSTDVVYTLRNTSPTTALEIQGVELDREVNLSQAAVEPRGPFTLGPGQSRTVTVSFQVEDLGSYGFDLVVDHTAGDGAPYRASAQGTGVLAENPIQAVDIRSGAPDSAWIGEVYQLRAEVVITPPAPGALQVGVVEEASGEYRHQGCVPVEEGGELVNQFEFSWTETDPGEKAYQVRARYLVRGQCPIGESFDAELSADHQVTWQEDVPELVVKRPEGVTVADGGVDDVGVHHWFNFVRVTYLLENTSRTTALDVQGFEVQDLVNLKRVQVQPSGPFRIEPGAEQQVEILFLVLTTDPFRFDLAVQHGKTGTDEYRVTIEGDGNLDIDEYVQDRRVMNHLQGLIDRGFFLRIPDYVLDLLESYLER